MLENRRPKFEERIRRLAGFGHRGSTTDHERAAADYLCDELAASGFRPERESFQGSSSFGGRILLHLIVAICGAAALWWMPVVSICVGLVVLCSLWAEQTTRGVWLSRPIVRSPSINISARLPVDAPRLRVIVSGHYDTQRTGVLWLLGKYVIPLLWWLPAILKPPLLLLGLVILGQVILSAVAIVTGSLPAISVANWIVLGAYAFAFALLGDWSIGKFVAGAADNATGAAAAIAVAEAWRDAPLPGVELVLLIPSCEETGMLGAAAWADRHRQELRDVPTLFLNFDNLGVGDPRFFGAEIPLFGPPAHFPPAMIEIAREAAADLGLLDPGPHTMPGPTDGIAFLVRGLRGMTIVSFRTHGYMPWYHLPGDTADHVDFVAAWQAVELGWLCMERMIAEFNDGH
jgi:hypothetical protein